MGSEDTGLRPEACGVWDVCRTSSKVEVQALQGKHQKQQTQKHGSDTDT